jgi:hypothetical protein
MSRWPINWTVVVVAMTIAEVLAIGLFVLVLR